MTGYVATVWGWPVATGSRTGADVAIVLLAPVLAWALLRAMLARTWDRLGRYAAICFAVVGAQLVIAVRS